MFVLQSCDGPLSSDKLYTGPSPLNNPYMPLVLDPGTRGTLLKCSLELQKNLHEDFTITEKALVLVESTY